MLSNHTPSPTRLANLAGLTAQQILKNPERLDPLLPLTERVAEAFAANSELRRSMAALVRWHAYFRPPAYPSHPDANGLGHAINTLVIAKALTAEDLRSGRLKPEQADMLCATALIHDLGEIGAGDVTYGGRDETQERKEIFHFKNSVAQFFPSLTANERVELLRLFVGIAFSGDPTLHEEAKYFNMVEVTGYTTFGLEMFQERPADFNWEVLAWRILRYHLFRENKDVPVHVESFAGARRWWRERIAGLDDMVEHFRRMDQVLFLETKYKEANLPDNGKPIITPINFERWPTIRETIVAGVQ